MKKDSEIVGFAYGHWAIAAMVGIMAGGCSVLFSEGSSQGSDDGGTDGGATAIDAAGSADGGTSFGIVVPITDGDDDALLDKITMDSFEFVNNEGLYLGTRPDPGAAGDVETIVALRFVDVPIPQDQQLMAAFIQFTAMETTNVPADFRIRVEQGECKGQSLSTPCMNMELKERADQELDGAIDWSVAGEWPADNPNSENSRSISIRGQLQDLVADDAWTPGGAVVIFIYNDSPRANIQNRVVHSFESATDSTIFAPRLVVR